MLDSAVLVDLGSARAVSLADLTQHPVDCWNRRLTQLQFTDGGVDVATDDEAVQPLRAGGQVAGFNFGEPRSRRDTNPRVAVQVGA